MQSRTSKAKLLPREKFPPYIEKALKVFTPAERFVVLEVFNVRQGKPPRGVTRARSRRRRCLQEFMDAQLKS